MIAVKKLLPLATFSLAACAEPASLAVKVEVVEPVASVEVIAEAAGEVFIDCTIASEDGAQSGACPFEEASKSWTGADSEFSFLLYGEPSAQVHLEALGLRDDGTPLAAASADATLPATAGEQGNATLRLPARSEPTKSCSPSIQLPAGTPESPGALTAIWRSRESSRDLVANLRGNIVLVSYEASQSGCSLSSSFIERTSNCPARAGDLASGQIDAHQVSNEAVALCRGANPSIRVFGYQGDGPVPELLGSISVSAPGNRISHPVLFDMDGDGRDEIALLYSPRATASASLRLVVYGYAPRASMIERLVDVVVLDGTLSDAVADIDIGPIVIQGGAGPEEILAIAGYGDGVFFFRDRTIEPRLAGTLLPSRIGGAVSLSDSEPPREVLAQVVARSLVLTAPDGSQDTQNWRYPIDSGPDLMDARHLRLASGQVDTFGRAVVLASPREVHLFAVGPEEKSQTYSIGDGSGSNAATLALLAGVNGRGGAEIFVFDSANDQVFGLNGDGSALAGWPVSTRTSGALRGAFFLDLDQDQSVELSLMINETIEVFSFGPGSSQPGLLAWPSRFGDLSQSSALTPASL